MKVTYMELVKDYIIDQTEKAYGLDNGYKSEYDSFGHLKDNIKWIPKSTTVTQDNIIYVSFLTIQDNNLWNWINKSNKITIDNGKKRATGKELIIKKLNKELANRKDQAIIIYDTKEFEDIYSCKNFEYYKEDSSKFDNYDKYGIIAILKLNEDNKIIDSMIQNDEILKELKKSQLDYLNTTVEYLS